MEHIDRWQRFAPLVQANASRWTQQIDGDGLAKVMVLFASANVMLAAMFSSIALLSEFFAAFLVIISGELHHFVWLAFKVEKRCVVSLIHLFAILGNATELSHLPLALRSACQNPAYQVDWLACRFITFDDACPQFRHVSRLRSAGSFIGIQNSSVQGDFNYRCVLRMEFICDRRSLIALWPQ